MKLLKSERQLSEYDFRVASGSNKVLTCTVIGPHEQTEGIAVETGPQGARRIFYIPNVKNKSLIQTLNDHDEVVPGSVLKIEWLKDNSEGEGEFEVHLDEDLSPKPAPSEDAPTV